jgi:hypothetical protein
MPPLQIPSHRLDLIERELGKALAEYPSKSALDRLNFVRALVRVVKDQVDDEATIPTLDEEIQP